MKKIVLIAVAAVSTSPSWAAATKPRPKRNEPAIIADLRSVAAAEAAYAKLNGGYFGEPPCLEKPASCLQNPPAGTPGLLSRELARMDLKDGYIRSFHSGGRVSPSS